MKTHFRRLFVVSFLFIMGACAGSKPEPVQKADFARGGRVFSVFCAQCHLNPDNDAPQLDEHDDWDLRTHDWTAILEDHVKKGFLDMPAKAGQSHLTEQQISDVLYYMDVKLRAQE